MAGSNNKIRVWNATSGYLQIDEAGQLLQSHESAWVNNSSGFIDNLLDEGLAVLVEGAPELDGTLGAQPKKSSRKDLSQSAQPKESGENAVVAQDKNDTDYMSTELAEDVNIADVSVETK